MREVTKEIHYDPNKINHLKASESYIQVEFKYERNTLNYWIPIVYRRTGLNLVSTEEIEKYLQDIYPLLNPSNRLNWLKEQQEFWEIEKSNAIETKRVFDIISTGEWTCIGCKVDNQNWARRFQDIKEFGYTFSTNTPVQCPDCKKKTTFVQVIMLPRYYNNADNGYETWSRKLRNRILKTLSNYDVYEAKISNNLLPDHKFPEIRWGKGSKGVNSVDMTEAEIRFKFQLMSNQRNLQKREVCRNCFQTGKRGIVFGINYFYEGDANWDPLIPSIGKDAEKGCIGCAWYDLDKWRKSLLEKII